MADKKKDDKKEKEKDEPEEKASAPKEAGKEGAAAEGEAKPEEGGKKKLPLKLIIIGGVGAVVLIGIIVAVLMFTGILGGKKPAADATATPGVAAAPGAAAGDKAPAKDEKKDGAAVFYDLGEMVVNLNTDSKRQTFLKLVVQLELESAADKPVIDNLKPRIIDNFQTYMRELRVDDLRGSAGLYRLREELLFRVNEAVHPVKIRDVLFQQMLVQ